MTESMRPPSKAAQLPLRLFFSGHEQTPPSHACGPGVWPHYLLHFILSGTGSFCSGGRSWRLGAGDAFLIIPGIVSSYISDTDTPWEYCWIGFDGRDAQGLLSSCNLTDANPVRHSISQSGTEPDFSADSKKSAAIGDCLLSVNDALLHDPGNTYLHLSLLYRFFSLLSPGGGGLQPDSDGYLKQALDYIHNNYAYDIKIMDIARHVGIDRTWLYKIFSRQLGISPQNYLIHYRLSTAKQLLSTTTLRITEISNSCGFSDSASLCRHFRAQFAITPSQFRKTPGNVPLPERKQTVAIPASCNE